MNSIILGNEVSKYIAKKEVLQKYLNTNHDLLKSVSDKVNEIGTQNEDNQFTFEIDCLLLMKMVLDKQRRELDFCLVEKIAMFAESVKEGRAMGLGVQVSQKARL